MEPRTVIVTGGNAGLGYEAAKNIAASDPSYHVVLACRSLTRGNSAARSLKAETQNTNITTMELDLASLSSVRAFYNAYRDAPLPPLYAVVCNAGISAGGVRGSARTEDGVETIFAVNHLGHFLLTNLLLNVMPNEGRIVFVTSDLHSPPRFFPVRVRYDNAAAIAHGTSGMRQYCTSKLCNLYNTYELDRLLSQRTDRRITVNAFNPGAMSDTGFSRPSGNALTRAAVRVIGSIMGTLIGKHSTASDSGAALASLVTDPALGHTTGKYLDRGTEVESSALSYNIDHAKDLWDTSMELSKLSWAETIFPLNSVSSLPANKALWLPKRGRRFDVAPAPYTRPGANEVVVRVRAVGLNLVDGIPGPAYRLILPWLTFPAVVGGDVAGEIVEVGARVDRLKVGDRVLGHALGVERSQNRPAEGAFQNYVVLMSHMVSPIPETLPFEQAAVLPLQLSTAATGLFQHDGLRLALPVLGAAERTETVLVWGGSTGVGSNAIQLARNAGYRVVATASPHNFDYMRSLGADATVDRNSAAAVEELVAAIGQGPLVGSIAIGNGSLLKVMRVAARVPGTKRVSSAAPALLTRVAALRAPRGVQVSGIWGGALKDNEVGPAIYTEFLPAALAAGVYQAAPEAAVVGHGLDAIPIGLRRLSGGVSAKKLVVTL